MNNRMDQQVKTFCDNVIQMLLELTTYNDRILKYNREKDIVGSLQTYTRFSKMVKKTSPEILAIFIALLFDSLLDNIEKIISVTGIKQWDIELPIDNVLTVGVFDEKTTKSVQN